MRIGIESKRGTMQHDRRGRRTEWEHDWRGRTGHWSEREHDWRGRTRHWKPFPFLCWRKDVWEQDWSGRKPERKQDWRKRTMQWRPSPFLNWKRDIRDLGINSLHVKSRDMAFHSKGSSLSLAVTNNDIPNVGNLREGNTSPLDLHVKLKEGDLHSKGTNPSLADLNKVSTSKLEIPKMDYSRRARMDANSKVGRRVSHRWRFSNETVQKEATTIFVADLPEEMDEIWLKNIFSGAGKIIEVKIPDKRTFRLNQRFGFIKYEFKSEGTKAINMWNSARIQGHMILVKFAKFGNKRWKMHEMEDPKPKQVYEPVKKAKVATGSPSINSEIPAIFEGGRTLSEQELNCRSIAVEQEGNGWLFRSAIAKLNPLKSMIYIQDLFKQMGHENILVRACDSNHVVLTFSSIQERDSIFNGGRMSWIKENFSKIQKWDDSILSQRSRLVWLNCYGIPLHVWNGSTFKKLGQIWGEIISISEESFNCLSFTVGKVLISTTHMGIINQVVTLVNNGRRYNIRISEEQFVINTYLRPDCKCKNYLLPEIQIVNLNAEKGVDGSMEIELTREEVEGLKGNKVAVAKGPALHQDKHKGITFMALAETSSSASGNEFPIGGNGKINHTREESAAHSIHSNEVVANSNSLEVSPWGTEISLEGIVKVKPYKEVAAVNNHCCSGNDLLMESQDSQVADSGSKVSSPSKEIAAIKGVSASVPEEQTDKIVDSEENQLQEPIKAVLKCVKGKKKRKSIEDILGLSKTDKLNSKGSKIKKKNVVFRSAVTAAAHSASISSGGIANRNLILLNEAQAVWECNKLLGLVYEGDEEEVVSRIAKMEANNIANAESRGADWHL